MSEKTVADYPELMKEWHPTKNGDLNPSDISYGSHKKIWWKCPVEDDHEWEAVTKSRSSLNQGCPCCSGHKVVLSNCLLTTHPKLAKQWHPTKNGNLTPYDVVSGSSKKIWWKCSKSSDHEWEATVDRRSNRGCPCCHGLKTVLSNCLATTHPFLIKEWHPTKNGNLTPYDIITGSHKKVWWKCDISNDHEWEATAKNRTALKQRCPCCANQKAVLSNCLATTHSFLIEEWHPTKNGNLTPYDVVAGSNKKIWWRCCKEHEWKTSIKNRKRGSCCPVCNESKGEKAVAKALTNFSLKFKRQWKFKSCKNQISLPFDFVVKTKNGIKIIEYQGEQHYKPVKIFGGEKEFIELQKRDLIKRNWCKKKKIPLLAINYLEFENIEQLVQAYINT